MRTGTLIRLCREGLGIARNDLAERSGVAYSTLVKIEQGVIEAPKLADVVSIARVLGKTCADFVADDAPEPETPSPGRPPAVPNPPPPPSPRPTTNSKEKKNK